MNQIFSRTERLFGEDGMKRLQNAKVIVFGVGGVGSYAVEALGRSGIGEIHLVDGDTVAESNINRQLIATTKTVGRQKTEVEKERLLEINPEIVVKTFPFVFDFSTKDKFDFSQYDYIIDAIDTVSSKILLCETANEKGIKIISCMGAGNKLDPTKFEVADISKTSVCPLAKVMRCELRKRGIKNLKVVFSKEEPCQGFEFESELENNAVQKRNPPASVAFVPSVAGLILAGEVIKDLVK